jgi:F-type H+-transporting ATPase subunit delta
MAELTTLARPYAKAAFDFANSANVLDLWSEMLALAGAVSNSTGIDKLLASPTLTTEQKGSAFIEICGDALNEQAGNFVKILAENKRLELLSSISQLFEAFKAQKEKSVDVELQSAFELSTAVQEQLAKALSVKLDREVNVTGSVDKSLIGGVIIRAGDTVIDGSVKGRLAKLAEAMNS